MKKIKLLFFILLLSNFMLCKNKELNAKNKICDCDNLIKYSKTSTYEDFEGAIKNDLKF